MVKKSEIEASFYTRQTHAFIVEVGPPMSCCRALTRADIMTNDLLLQQIFNSPLPFSSEVFALLTLNPFYREFCMPPSLQQHNDRWW